MKYIARRVLHSSFLLLGISLLCFLFSNLAPGDILSEMRLDPRISPEALATMRVEFGLDQPMPARYAIWLTSALTGNLGYSLAYRAPVGSLLRARIPATLLLTGAATLLAWMIGVPLGVWSATAGGIASGVLSLLLSFLLAVPELLLILALLVFAARTGYFPVGGMTSISFDSMTMAQKFRDIAWHMALPVSILMSGIVPVIVRHVRASMAEILDSTFVLSARAQGIPHRRLLFRHVLPAALNPLISLAGLSFGTLLSASLLIEVVAGWPGLGPLFFDAVMARDFALVLGVVMLASAFLIAGNLLADILLYELDPRIREVT